jgi:uncharacterized damage-inducible protein DinB
MSDELTRLEQQVRLALEGEAWHGPAVLEVLADVSADAAAAHPIPGAHSIWEIVLHMTATYRLVLRRAEGRSGAFSPEEDWPAVDVLTAERWRSAVDELHRANRDLRIAILEAAEEQLDEPLAAGHSSAYMHFAGIVQHDAYHAGQITLLKKALAGKPL